MAPTHTKKPSGKTSSSAASSKPKRKPSSGPKPPATQHKPKSGAISSQIQQKRKKPPHLRYTEKELNIPQLNGIKPAGVQKPTNAKKGKNFVDDREGMNAILALVMAEKEGNIESKMMRARQMEEIREARRLEAEKRAQSKKEGLEERKQGIKGSKSRHKSGSQTTEPADANEQDAKPKSNRKRVSFG